MFVANVFENLLIPKLKWKHIEWDPLWCLGEILLGSNLNTSHKTTIGHEAQYCKTISIYEKVINLV
jgi:hypothetical protein